jgi:hypothetical protein
VPVLVTIEAVALALLALLVAGLLRSHAEILRALHGLGAGIDHDVDLRVQPGVVPPRSGATAAFDLVGTTPTDESVIIGVVGARHGTLVAFLSSGCLTCARFWDALRDPPSLALPEDTRLVVVTKGPDAESESKVRELAPPGISVVMSSSAWDDYEVPVAPYFIYVDGPSGRVIGEGAAARWEQVASLLSQALADAGLAAGRARGARRRGRHREGGPSREARADGELMAAGVFPGDPSLYVAEGDGRPRRG